MTTNIYSTERKAAGMMQYVEIETHGSVKRKCLSNSAYTPPWHLLLYITTVCLRHEDKIHLPLSAKDSTET